MLATDFDIRSASANGCNKIALIWLTALILQGCAKSAPPTYPGELQMIIAQNNHGDDNRALSPAASSALNPALSPANPQGKSSGISISELIRSVRTRHHPALSSKGNSSSHNATAQGDQPPADWRGLQLAAAMADTAPRPQTLAGQRQMQLVYGQGQALPYTNQLLLVKRLAAEQDMIMISIKMGRVSGETAFSSANIAHKRTTALLGQLIQQPAAIAAPRLEYQPQLGLDLAVVTFIKRRS